MQLLFLLHELFSGLCASFPTQPLYLRHPCLSISSITVVSCSAFTIGSWQRPCPLPYLQDIGVFSVRPICCHCSRAWATVRPGRTGHHSLQNPVLFFLIKMLLSFSLLSWEFPFLYDTSSSVSRVCCVLPVVPTQGLRALWFTVTSWLPFALNFCITQAPLLSYSAQKLEAPNRCMLVMCRALVVGLSLTGMRSLWRQEQWLTPGWASDLVRPLNKTYEWSVDLSIVNLK